MRSNPRKTWKLAALSIVTCVGTLQIGCTDREVGAGVAGAIIGAIIVDANNNPPPPPPRPVRCEPYTVEHCETIRTYRGSSYQCTTRIVRRCGPHYKIGIAGSATDLDVGQIAQTYKLTNDGAEKLVSALTTARTAQDDAAAQTAMSQIGINLNEIRALGTSGTPSSEMIDHVAMALDQHPEETAKMVNGLLRTARVQEAARNQR